MQTYRHLNLLDTDLRRTLRVFFDLRSDAAFTKFGREVVHIFLTEMCRVLVEALLDAVWQAQASRMTVEQRKRASPSRIVTLELGWADVSSYYKSIAAASLAFDKAVFILVFYGRWIRFDTVHAIKRGYRAATTLCAQRLPALEGKKVDMAQIDALLRILLSAKNPLEEAEKDSDARPWVRSFLLAMTILSDEYPEVLKAGLETPDAPAAP